MLIFNTTVSGKGFLGEETEVCSEESTPTKKLVGITILTALVSTLTAKLVDKATNTISTATGKGKQVTVYDTEDVTLRLSPRIVKTLADDIVDTVEAKEEISEE
jgi:hypothetical protein